MKTILQVKQVSHRLNSGGKRFYLSTVLLDDGEEYSLASSNIPKVGDMVEAWFDDKWQKAKARYP